MFLLRSKDIFNSLGFVLTLLLPLALVMGRAWADIVLSSLAGCFLLHMVLSHHYVALRRADAKAALAIWVAVWLSNATNFNTIVEFTAAAGWLRFPLAYIALRYWIFTTDARMELFIRSTVAILCLVGADTLYQYLIGTSLTGRPMMDHRLTGPLTHPNIGNYFTKLMFPVLAFAALYLMKDRRKTIAFTIALFFFLSGLILVSGERSTSLMLLFGTGVTAIGAVFLIPKIRVTVISATSCFLLMVVALYMTQPVTQARSEKLVSDVGSFWQTPYGQLFIGGYTLWQEHPVFGIGTKQYEAVCPSLMERGIVTYCDLHPHNIHLQWLAETGLLGYICFVLFAILLLRETIQVIRHTLPENRLVLLGVLAALSIVFFPFIVTQSLFSNWPAALMWTALGLAMAIADATTRKAAS